MGHKDKKNKTSFKPGNKANEKYNLEQATELFNNVYEFAKTNNRCYSLQNAIHSHTRHSTYYHLLNRFPELDKFKKDTFAVIIDRLNIGAIEGDFNPTACIWRMKQSGEVEKQTIETNVTTFEIGN